MDSHTVGAICGVMGSVCTAITMYNNRNGKEPTELGRKLMKYGWFRVAVLVGSFMAAALFIYALKQL